MKILFCIFQIIFSTNEGPRWICVFLALPSTHSWPSGGMDILFGGQKSLTVDFEGSTVLDLILYLKNNKLTEREELFVIDNHLYASFSLLFQIILIFVFLDVLAFLSSSMIAIGKSLNRKTHNWRYSSSFSLGFDKIGWWFYSLLIYASRRLNCVLLNATNFL